MWNLLKARCTWLLLCATLCSALTTWKMLQFHERLAALENDRWERTLSHLNVYRRPIVLFGDSEISRWPVATSFGLLPVLNRGLAGDLATLAEARFKDQVLPLNPSVVVILIGTNDIGHGKPAEEVLGTIERMMVAAQTRSEVVILCSVLPARGEAARVRPAIGSVNSGLRALARTHNAIFADLHSVVSDQNDAFAVAYSDDGLHPNSIGYVRLTQALLPLLLNSFRLTR